MTYPRNNPGRQAHPIGDLEHGQYVQVNKPIATEELVINWQDFEALTVSSTALKLTQNLVGYDYAILTVAVDAIRFRLDHGAVPTASVGHHIAAGSELILESVEEIKDFRMIRVTNDATVSVSYGNRIRNLS